MEHVLRKSVLIHYCACSLFSFSFLRLGALSTRVHISLYMRDGSIGGCRSVCMALPLPGSHHRRMCRTSLSTSSSIRIESSCKGGTCCREFCQVNMTHDHSLAYLESHFHRGCKAILADKPMDIGRDIPISFPVAIEESSSLLISYKIGVKIINFSPVAEDEISP